MSWGTFHISPPDEPDTSPTLADQVEAEDEAARELAEDEREALEAAPLDDVRRPGVVWLTGHTRVDVASLGVAVELAIARASETGEGVVVGVRPTPCHEPVPTHAVNVTDGRTWLRPLWLAREGVAV